MPDATPDPAGDFHGADDDDLDVLRRFARLRLQQREIEAELETLKPAVTDLALCHGADGRDGARFSADGVAVRFRVHARYRYAYSDELRQMEERLRAFKKREEKDGTARCEGVAAVLQMTVEA